MTSEAPLSPVAPAVRRARPPASRLWRRTTMARAMGEGVVIYVAGRLLAMVAPSAFPAAIFPAVLMLRLVLLISPPVWAALRVTSTRREKMSRRFWLLGPALAAACTVVDALVALALGDALLAKMRGNGHAHQADLAQLRARIVDLGATLQRGLRRIDRWGVLVKDLETGLVDFPTLRDGREVLLCWRLGETGIHWWHTIEGGFAARQPLED